MLKASKSVLDDWTDFATFETRRWRILNAFGDHRYPLIRRGAGRFRAESISASNGYPTGVLLIGTVTTRNKGSLHSGPILPFSSLSYPPYHNNHVSREERNSRMDRSRSYGSGHGHSAFERWTQLKPVLGFTGFHRPGLRRLPSLIGEGGCRWMYRREDSSGRCKGGENAWFNGRQRPAGRGCIARRTASRRQ